MDRRARNSRLGHRGGWHRGPRVRVVHILAIDTATAATSVAVVGSGGSVRCESQVIDARRHAEAIAPLIRDVLAEARVDASAIDLVACGVGPGPFTGLRVGIATGVAIAEGRGIPVVGVCSLDVIARRAVRDYPGSVTVLTRARRAELCWAAYDEHAQRLAGPLIRSENDLDIHGTAVGDAGPVDVVMYPQAGVLADLVAERLASGEPLPDRVELPEEGARESGAATADILHDRAQRGLLLLPARPLYLRRPDAVVPASMGGGA